MEDYFLAAFGIIVSCTITCIILFQFMEERYERIYHKKVIYFLLQVGTCGILMMINALGIPILNMISWLICFSINTTFFYIEHGKHTMKRIFEIVGLILVLTLCETIGYLILEFVLWKVGIQNISSDMLQCLGMTFSKLVMILFYYVVISKIWKYWKQSGFTVNQWMIYIVLIVYSLANLSVVIYVVSRGLAVSFTERLLLLINLFCIVFADLYFIYFTKFTQENGQLKWKLNLLEQQSVLQYEYYANQEKKYNESIKILHDVNKHLDMMKEIYRQNRSQEANEYAEEIGKILSPLVVHQYVGSPILNILLNDKKHHATLHNIQMSIEVRDVDLHFMDAMEITTVFGNLLDNAIEACNSVTDRERLISVKLTSYNDFLVIQISNTSKKIIKWINGKPVSEKGKNHGIGLLNVESVVEKYNGNMILEEIEGIFSCKIIFSTC